MATINQPVIKMRVWDIEKQVIVHDWRQIIPRHQKEVSNADFQNSRFIFMRYTGINDRDGVEIYEGDIVLTKSCNIRPVVYRSENAGFNINYRAKHHEVIGNIYENLDLLR